MRLQPLVWQWVRRHSERGSSRLELAHEPGPQQPGGPQLGHLHEEVHAHAPEEAEPGGELVDSQPRGQPGPGVLHAVGEGVGQLDVEGGPRLLHVVAGDRDRVEPPHPLGGEGDDVGHDPHRRRRRVDERVADHELLEDVVLDGPGELLGLHALLLRGHDVEGQHRQHRAVHGHRDGHLVERDAVEQDPHVEDRVDGHPGHAHVPGHPGVVGVVAPVGGQVEGHRQAPLARGQVAAVEGVGLLRGGEPRVLADRPGPGHIHGGVRPPHERRQTRIAGHEVGALEVVGTGQRRHGDALGRLEHRGTDRRGDRLGRGVAVVKLDPREVWDRGHGPADCIQPFAWAGVCIRWRWSQRSIRLQASTLRRGDGPERADVAPGSGSSQQREDARHPQGME